MGLFDKIRNLLGVKEQEISEGQSLLQSLELLGKSPMRELGGKNREAIIHVLKQVRAQSGKDPAVLDIVEDALQRLAPKEWREQDLAAVAPLLDLLEGENLSDAPKLRGKLQEFFRSQAGQSMMVGVRSTKPIRNKEEQIGRNDPCPCKSGKKYKQCCLKR